MDLVELLVRVAGWVYWLAWAAALGSAGASFLFMALGDRDRAVTLFKGSIAAVLVAAFGQTLLLSVIGVLGGWQLWSAQAGQVTRYPEAGTLVYVLAFTLLLLAAVNLARGHVSEGGWMIMGSVLALAIVVFAANAFNTTVMAYGGGPLLIEARTDRAVYEPGQQVFLFVTVRSSGLSVNTADLYIDWGDGSGLARVQGVPVGREVKICMQGNDWIHASPDYKHCSGKTYSLRSGEEFAFYTIKIEAVAQAGGSRLAGIAYVTVYVRELPKLSFPFSMLGGLLNWMVNMLTGGMLDPTRLFYAPVFRFDGPEGEWYRTMLKAAVALLPVFLLFRIAPGLAYDPGRAVVDGFRDAAVAVVAMILVPHAYNVMAGALNSFTELIAGPAGASVVSQMAGTAIAWAVVFMIVSLVSPGVGFLGTTILVTVFLVAALATLRWFLLITFVSVSPLLVLAWLNPYLRGAAESVKGLAGAMLLAGPLAAAFTMFFSKVMLGDNPAQQLGASFALSWLGMFIVGLLPQFVSGLAVSGLGGAIAGKLGSAAMGGAPQVGKAVTAAGAKGLAAGAAVAGRAGYAQAMRVKPLADVMRAGGVMVGRARETASKAVSGLQRRLEGRLARDETKHAGAMARHDALTELKRGFQEYGDLKQRSEDARLRLANALEYHQGLSSEEQENPENLAGLALARMEYDTLEEVRAEREPQLKEKLKKKLEEYEENNLITHAEHKQLKTGLQAPQLAVKALDKMIEEQEYEVRLRKAELERDKAIHGRFAEAIGKFREVPARLRKVAGDFLTIPRKTEKKDPAIKVSESA